jgi:hypothetical protein
VPLAPVGFNLIEAPPHVSPFSFRSCVPPAVGWVLAPRPSPRPKPPNQLLPPGFSAMLPQRLTLDFRGFPSRESVHLLVVLPTVQGRSSSRFTGPRTSLQEQPTAGLPFWPDRRSNSYSRSCHRFFASGPGNSASGALPWTSSVGCLWPKPENTLRRVSAGNSEPLVGKPSPLLSLMDPAATVPLRHGEITAQAEASVMVCTPRRAVTDPLPVLLANNGQLAATGSSGACCPPWLRPKPKPVLAVEHHRATHVGLPESVAGSGWLPWVARGPLPASRRSPV